jgi:5-methylcytosine-specific restriction protein B
MTLVEVDKRYKEYSIQLTYHQGESDGFYVPDNVLILGTMNTADRSLALLDYALRRRFAFLTIEPAFGTDLFEEYLLNRDVEPSIVDLINEKMIELNSIIADDKRNLGSGFEIGHSFFCPLETGKYGKEWYEIKIKTEIAPLIKAYWFDNEEFAQERIAALLP